MVLTLIAFTLQSFATQTHIHIQPAGAPVAVDVFDGVPAKGKVPAKNDEANCPLCQAFASAGHFVTPAVAATLLPTFSISIIALVFRASHLAPAVSHNWHGRAPPLG
ncbi:MAG TPA: DUF2946 family protein [Rhizomicrobium sp.]